MAGSIFIIKSIYDSVRKSNFSKLYKIGKLPASIKVRKKLNEKGKNYYNLNYPYWSVSKRDGTADRRVKQNSIIWEKSNLYVDNYLIFSKRPYDANELGVQLINGNSLIQLLDKQGFIKKEKVEIGLMECQLETSDLYPYVPHDIYENFFE